MPRNPSTWAWTPGWWQIPSMRQAVSAEFSGSATVQPDALGLKKTGLGPIAPVYATRE